MSLDELYMRRCFQLAEKGLGTTRSNPLVGALLVYEGRVIGEGYHACFGEAHAEVNCLASVAEEDKHLIKSASMYVSLEPCAHYGKTPPCAHRIVAEGVPEVIIANQDPFVQVAGKGIRILEEAGLKLRSGVLANEGEWLNRRFFTHCRLQRPYIILKWAETADGFMAPVDRSRLQLTNGLSQRISHQWRTEEMAIMVGYTTALNDNPQLTARLVQGRQPLRIVIDKDLQLPATHHLFDQEAPTWVLNRQKEEQDENIRYVQVDFRLDIIDQLMPLLAKEGIVSLIVEGGAKLLDHFVARQLWDEARIFVTDHRLGKGIPAPRLSAASTVYEADLMNDRLLIQLASSSLYTP